MNELRDIFIEVVIGAPPVGPVSADDVFTLGRRRRRRRRALATAGALTLAGAVLAGGLVLTGPDPRPPIPRPAGPPSATTPSADPWNGRQILWTGAADTRNLYRLYLVCTGAPCRVRDKTMVHLAGSDDGGRTWTDRGEPISSSGFLVAGGETLIAVRPAGPAGAAVVTSSTDGGRRWTVAQKSAEVSALPAGNVPFCVPVSGAPCQLHAVDPERHRSALLASQPPLRLTNTLTDQPSVVELAGRLWARGTDYFTRRPAVASSADGGRTWSTAQVFAEASVRLGTDYGLTALAAGNGPTVYAMLVGPGGFAGYRYTDQTGWRRLDGLDGIPYYKQGDVGSFVTRDNTHVVYQLVNDPAANRDRYRFWAERGGAYRPVELAGLPDPAGPIRRTPDGWYHTIDHTGQSYGSTDGWTWTPLPGK